MKTTTWNMKRFDMETRIVTITPKIAAEMLSRNRNVRAINETHVNRLAEMMLASRWWLNGESIKFDIEGQLIDGQHRLSAVVKSGVTIQALCVYNVPISFGVDEGRLRTVGDLLGGASSEKKREAAVLRILYQVMRGGDPFARFVKRPNFELITFYEKAVSHVRMDVACKIAARLRELFTPSIVASIIYQGTTAETPDDVETSAVANFFATAKNGSMLAEGSPELTLRRWCESESNARRQGSAYARAKYVAYGRAWNAWATRSPLTRHGMTGRIHTADLPVIEVVKR